MKNFLLLTIFAWITVFAPVQGFAGGKGGQGTPHDIIDDLRQKMYVIGETSGKINKFIEADQEAAGKITLFIEMNVNPDKLAEKNNVGQTPLMSAAFNGYVAVSAALLSSNKVVETINETNPKGLTAWMYANMAFRQAAWVCNPGIFDAPFSFVPLFVTQPYFVSQPENPYIAVRRMIEEKGAKTDLPMIKQKWMEFCPNQSQETKKRIEKSKDLLETVLEDGINMLATFINKSSAAKNNPTKKR